MGRILVVTTVYRTGEKVYPVFKRLAEKHHIDVLNLYQMSQNTEWSQGIDLRQSFYKEMSHKKCRLFHGPGIRKGKESDADETSIKYTKYFDHIEKTLEYDSYDFCIIDNNITTKGGQENQLYIWLNKHKIPVISCPHGNRDFNKYRITDRIGRIYDYSFLFGRKERKKIIFTESAANKSDRLFIGGIPSNDELSQCQRKNKYILIIPNYTDSHDIKGQVSGFKVFNKKLFDDLGILDLAQEFNCGIVIKEKHKIFHYRSEFKESMSSYPVNFVLDSDNDNQLVANAKVVISAPSTMSFKSIQLGIPTAVLSGHGMIGNFYDFDGLVSPSKKAIRKTIENQIDSGRNHGFIERTLSGGLDFKSTQSYLNVLERFLK